MPLENLIQPADARMAVMPLLNRSRPSRAAWTFTVPLNTIPPALVSWTALMPLVQTTDLSGRSSQSAGTGLPVMTEIADLGRKVMEYLYKDGDGYYLMDPESYEQVQLDRHHLETFDPFLQPNMKLTVEFLGEEPIHVVFPEWLEPPALQLQLRYLTESLLRVLNTRAEKNERSSSRMSVSSRTVRISALRRVTIRA